MDHMKRIKILGIGCAKCHKLVEVTEQAAQELALEYELEKVTDLKRIMGFGVMMTPAVAIDGVIKKAGSVPTEDEIAGWLK